MVISCKKSQFADWKMNGNGYMEVDVLNMVLFYVINQYKSYIYI